MPEFDDQLPGLFSPIEITEKIDGIPAAIRVEGAYSRATYSFDRIKFDECPARATAVDSDGTMTDSPAGAGFVLWVKRNQELLATALGVGVHRGEWWGQGIKRGYGPPFGIRRFSIFDPKTLATPTELAYPGRDREERAAVLSQAADIGLGTVPVLARGINDTVLIRKTLTELLFSGSVAAPGYMDPEGIVVRHTGSGQRYVVLASESSIPRPVSRIARPVPGPVASIRVKGLTLVPDTTDEGLETPVPTAADMQEYYDYHAWAEKDRARYPRQRSAPWSKFFGTGS